ncbi:methyltransferase family protein [Microvirga lenta]|uniref:methyltransferase family protein n=1 Tax=Microvirga lenta TaxID=2881337 RepID=UPI001CFE34E8|nr:isoprenylcysteine carboxylmethyltransferase family protein [Microvirga lenta]MCB5174487.1 isoprenylcysteine carboxylmethyltransferase family protein [Microvirga lenta]
MKQIILSGRPVNLPFVLDMVERAIAAAFFGFFALRLLNAYLETETPIYLLLLFSECLVVGFLLVRRTTSDVSLRPSDWCVAVAGTTLPLLVTAGGEPLVDGSISAVFMLIGLGLNIWAKLSLRRSFGIVAANRGVKTRGPYSFIRHPMYFGYVVTQVGFLLFNPTLWNLMIYAAAFMLQVLRISAEERTLSRDPQYEAYAESVRYRLIPGVF